MGGVVSGCEEVNRRDGEPSGAIDWRTWVSGE